MLKTLPFWRLPGTESFLRTVNAEVELWFLELVAIKPSLASALRSILPHPRYLSHFAW